MKHDQNSLIPAMRNKKKENKESERGVNSVTLRKSSPRFLTLKLVYLLKAALLSALAES